MISNVFEHPDYLTWKKHIQENEEKIKSLRSENYQLESKMEELVLFHSGINEDKLVRLGGFHPSSKKYEIGEVRARVAGGPLELVKDNGEKVYKHHRCKIVVKGKKEGKLERYVEIGKVLRQMNKHHGREFSWLDLVNENCEYSYSTDETTFTFSVYYWRQAGCCKYASPPENWTFPEVPVIHEKSRL